MKKIEEFIDEVGEMRVYMRILKNSLIYEELEYDEFIEYLYKKLDNLYTNMEEYSISLFQQ